MGLNLQSEVVQSRHRFTSTFVGTRPTCLESSEQAVCCHGYLTDCEWDIGAREFEGTGDSGIANRCHNIVGGGASVGVLRLL